MPDIPKHITIKDMPVCTIESEALKNVVRDILGEGPAKIS
jgi:hypothetical protein